MADKKIEGTVEVVQRVVKYVTPPPTFQQKEEGVLTIMQRIAGAGGAPGPDGARKGVCATCGGPVDGFRDRGSVREYHISGMCQKCQDSVFGI